MRRRLLPLLPPLASRAFQEIVPIMDLAVNEEFTRMYSEEELMGARRIQVLQSVFLQGKRAQTMLSREAQRCENTHSLQETRVDRDPAVSPRCGVCCATV